MVLVMLIYLLIFNLDDIIVVMEVECKNYFFFDVYVCGIYLGYMKCYFRENNIELDVIEEDLEIFKNIVDFIFFSYYMSIIEIVDELKCKVGVGNILGGV